ncbi:hypothetical protein AcW1_002932 [Taiwanofungus camphoratus]|nr:hypothetical protein AcW1_002932 [Antrodia cinnamomea]
METTTAPTGIPTYRKATSGRRKETSTTTCNQRLASMRRPPDHFYTCTNVRGRVPELALPRSPMRLLYFQSGFAHSYTAQRTRPFYGSRAETQTHRAPQRPRNFIHSTSPLPFCLYVSFFPLSAFLGTSAVLAEQQMKEI